MRSETAPTSSVKNQRPLQSARLSGLARLTVVVAALALLLAAPAGSNAASLAEKRAQAARIATQVNALESDFDHLQERFRGAQYRLSDLDGDIDKLGASLDRTRGQLDTAEVRLVQRVVSVYKDGRADGTLLALARSGSFEAFLARMDTIDRVSGQDKQIVQHIRGLRTKVVSKKKQLKEARVEQASVVAQRRKDKASMEKKLRKRERVLASVNGEILAMVAAEQARQAAAAQAAARASGEKFAASGAAPASRSPTTAASPAGEAGPSTSTDVGAALSAPAPAAPPPSSGSGGGAVGAAMSQMGVPYKWGGSTPSTGFDCSGLVMWAFAQVGVSVPHSTYALWNIGTRVSRDQLQPGDMVFFSGLGHMGLYMGGGNFVHSPRTGSFVRVDSMSSSYAMRNYVGAVRA